MSTFPRHPVAPDIPSTAADEDFGRWQWASSDSNPVNDDGAAEGEANAIDRSALEIWENDQSLQSAARDSSDTASPEIGEFSDDSVRMYFQEIGETNLLNRKDEVMLSRAIESSRRLDRLENETRLDAESAPDSPVILLEILRQLGALSEGSRVALSAYHRPSVRNTRDEQVGEVRGAFKLQWSG